MFWQRFYDLCVGIGSRPNPIGKKLGIASGAISAWKTGTIPDREALVKIADFFECSIDYLLGRTENPQAHKAGNNVTVGDISGNSGIVGNVVNSSVDNTISLNEQEIALLDLFRSLDIVTRSRVITTVADMREKLQGGKQND